MQGPPWHTLDLERVVHQLRTTVEGLDSGEAARRRAAAGPNALPESRRRRFHALLLEQFRDFMILVLLASAVITGLVGEPQDTAAILVIVLLNAIVGTVQQYRAERAVAALRRLSAPVARVVRDGAMVSLDAIDIVPGDLVVLEAGGLVPADLRLTESAELQVDESALTGESQPVEKQTAPLAKANLALGDRNNLAFSGSLVTRGRGRGLAVATGQATEIGRIAGLLHGEKEVQTPLQVRLARFGRHLALAVIAICAIVFTAGLLQGQPVSLMFMTAVSLAVAAIPEALPAVVTVSLALGAHKLIAQRALVRNLPAVETLGSVTYICSDKTGTLTENRMSAERFLAAGREERVLPAADAASRPWTELGHAMALNNDVAEVDGRAAGDPTEVAFYAAAATAGHEKAALEARWPRLFAIPFDSRRKAMTTVHAADGDVVAYVKGAPEVLLPLCVGRLGGGGVEPMDAEGVLADAARLAAEGYRVMAFARRGFSSRHDLPPADEIERELTLLGLVALIDPPRRGVAEAVAACRDAGITPVMITGDHPDTAEAIARRLGILKGDGRLLTGPELERLSDEAFAGEAGAVRVYARVSPRQKLRIVKTLQARGEFVAMTGDGVNDAPALKRAGIGVAMGGKGTDVAREAADMVLLDDNFATIVGAVRAGRRIFDNIRKFIKYTMSSNSGEIWTLFLAPLLGLPIPLLPIHILWINLVTDGLPGLALTAEPAEPGIMKRPPRPPGENIFAHGMWQHILWVGLFLGGLSIASQAWAIARGVDYWQTVVFTVLTVSQLFHSLAVRSETASLFGIGLLGNPAMLAAVLFTLLLQLAVIYSPALNAVFHTQPLPLPDLLVCIGVSSLVLLAVEIEKLLVRRGLVYRVGG